MAVDLEERSGEPIGTDDVCPDALADSMPRCGPVLPYIRPSAFPLVCCVVTKVAALAKHRHSVASMELHAVLRYGYAAIAATPRAQEVMMKAHATWYAIEPRVTLKSGMMAKRLARNERSVPDISQQKPGSEVESIAFSGGWTSNDRLKPMHVGTIVPMKKTVNRKLGLTFSCSLSQ